MLPSRLLLVPAWVAVVIASAVVTSPAAARSVINEPPANGNTMPPPKARTAGFAPRTNWLVLCSGCHLPQANGAPDIGVPRLHDFVGNFLKVEGGREYLVRVPGAAQSPLTDAQLAALMNWILEGPIAGASAPDDFTPYTATEVGALRAESFLRPGMHRGELLRLMRTKGIQAKRP